MVVAVLVTVFVSVAVLIVEGALLRCCRELWRWCCGVGGGCGGGGCDGGGRILVVAW